MNSVIALFHVNLSVMLTESKSTIKRFCSLVGKFGLGGGGTQINYVLVLVRSSNITDGMLMGDVVTSCFLCKT